MQSQFPIRNAKARKHRSSCNVDGNGYLIGPVRLRAIRHVIIYFCICDLDLVAKRLHVGKDKFFVYHSARFRVNKRKRTHQTMHCVTEPHYVCACRLSPVIECWKTRRIPVIRLPLFCRATVSCKNSSEITFVTSWHTSIRQSRAINWNDSFKSQKCLRCASDRLHCLSLKTKTLNDFRSQFFFAFDFFVICLQMASSRLYRRTTFDLKTFFGTVRKETTSHWLYRWNQMHVWRLVGKLLWKRRLLWQQFTSKEIR